MIKIKLLIIFEIHNLQNGNRIFFTGTRFFYEERPAFLWKLHSPEKRKKEVIQQRYRLERECPLTSKQSEMQNRHSGNHCKLSTSLRSLNSE